MFNFLRKTYRVKFTKTFTILKEDDSRLFRNSSYKLTRTIEGLTRVPDIGDHVTVYDEDSLFDEHLGTVENRQVFLDTGKSKSKKFKRPDYLISLRPIETKIFGETLNDVDVGDVHDIWVRLFYEHVTMKKFKFERPLGKSDWELWDGWVDVFVENELFPYDNSVTPFRWTPENLGFSDGVI